ncbi:MAG: UDP-3-O-(3-hydroxymyristoyl)glucosamine N-acyltransferase [Porticoccaceae bacterium]|nr:UDP-3-O-(3-hydroxymyristoyl)glucosamine N-acyltransferase [Porticoccaceae bacterium]
MTHDYSLGEIAAYLKAELRGDPEVRIKGLNTLQNAEVGQLAFLSNPKYSKDLADTHASAVILSEKSAMDYSGDCLMTADPYLAYALISEWFTYAESRDSFVHSSVTLDVSAKIAANVYLGPNVVIKEDVVIDAGCYIESNTVVGARSKIGENSHISSNVTIYHDVTIGNSARIHSGAVIGADGFGFAPRETGGWQKIHQLGGVTIGNNVEVGACTTIDRGALNDTRVGNGVILDNHVQIAHNAVVGDNTAMAAYAGIAGSSTVGRNCILGGDVKIVGHLMVCDNVMFTAKTLVTKSVTEPGSYSSGAMPLMKTVDWRKNSVRIGQLDDIARRLKKLEE